MFKSFKTAALTLKVKGENATRSLGAKMLVRSRDFISSERGDIMGFLVMALIVVLMGIGLYLIFKTEINTFVKNMIFGKLNNLE